MFGSPTYIYWAQVPSYLRISRMEAGGMEGIVVFLSLLNWIRRQ